ncbi:MAG: DNRLRE domain-containing protein [Candidatus Azobacteroides sp.]|nr:DNRLRE domain-containing protein [Candidatus Azobacteroides sp.]
MKNQILFFYLFLFVAIYSSGTEKEFFPLDDTYVFSNGGTENMVIKHIEDGSRLRTYTHQNDDQWTYTSYLKFDLSGICNNPDLIEEAKFRICGKENQGNFEHFISLYALANNEWSEDALTYENRTIVGEAVKITTLVATVGNTQDK